MCKMHQIDTQKAEAFSQTLLDILNHASLAFMTSVGHRTGLFDTMREMPPATSSDIAEAAGLDERYVREWLGAMTAGRIVNCQANGGAPLFSLPAEHAAFLTRAAGADNIGVFAQYFAVMGSVEDKIVDCFENGGGVPYSEFARFHEVMAEDSGQSIVSSLFEAVLPLAPGLTDRLTRGIKVLDLGCGMGRALTMMAKAYPDSQFVGYDLCEEPIALANKAVREQGLDNIRFEVRDLTTFDADAPQAEFDFITTFDAVHDQARPDRLLAGINKALKDDGLYLMQDISASSNVLNNLDHPIGALLYTVSTFHCMTVSLAQEGMGLGTMWGREKAEEMLRQAGFNRIEVKNLSHDFQNDYYLVRKN